MVSILPPSVAPGKIPAAPLGGQHEFDNALGLRMTLPSYTGSPVIVVVELALTVVCLWVCQTMCASRVESGSIRLLLHSLIRHVALYLHLRSCVERTTDWVNSVFDNSCQFECSYMLMYDPSFALRSPVRVRNFGCVRQIEEVSRTSWFFRPA